MMLAQQLYEEGLITYHRTDSVNLSQQAIGMAREYIKKEFGAEYLPKSANTYKAKSKNAQEAHEAIRPTGLASSLPADSALTDRHAKLYDSSSVDLLPVKWCRLCMTSPQFWLMESKENTLVARLSGSIIRMPGWMKLFPGSDDTILPEVKPQETLDFQELLAEQNSLSHRPAITTPH